MRWPEAFSHACQCVMVVAIVYCIASCTARKHETGSGAHVERSAP